MLEEPSKLTLAERRKAYMKERLQKRREQGLCTRCDNMAIPGLSYCAACKERVRSNTKDWAAKNRAKRKIIADRWASKQKVAGRCPRCGGEPLPGNKYCPTCQEKGRAEHNKTIKSDDCVRCGRPRRPHCKTCQACHDETSRNQIKRHERLRTAGLCIECGKQPPADGIARCEECRNCHLQEHRERKARRRQAGMCPRCGVGPPIVGKNRCRLCYLKTTAQSHFRTADRAGELLALFEHQGGRCAISGRSLTLGVDTELDHITPVARGGSLEMDNVQWLWSVVNRLKGGDRTDSETREVLRQIAEAVASWPR